MYDFEDYLLVSYVLVCLVVRFREAEVIYLYIVIVIYISRRVKVIDMMFILIGVC